VKRGGLLHADGSKATRVWGAHASRVLAIASSRSRTFHLAFASAESAIHSSGPVHRETRVTAPGSQSSKFQGPTSKEIPITKLQQGSHEYPV